MSADAVFSEASDAWTRAAGLLWPGATVSRATRGELPNGRVLREFVFIPDAQRPRLLLPAGAPRAAAAALQRYSHDLRAAERVVRKVGSAALSTGLAERAFPDILRVTALPAADAGESVEARLTEILGRPVVVSIGLGTTRANRKPVLHVLSHEGETVAFVKVGDSDVARELVRAEVAALTYLSTRPLSHLNIPRVLHHGEWRGVELLVLSPLPTTARRWKRRSVIPVDAMAELFAVGGVERRAAGESPLWRGISGVADRLADPKSSRLLSQAVAKIGAVHGATMLELGAWHGDWTPWNMAWRRGDVQLWDWERFAHGVPRGFDALHYRLQDGLRSAKGRRGTPPLPEWTAGAADALVQLGVSGPAARVTTALYLLELCRRYLLAAQGSAGTPLRPQATSLLRDIHDHAERL